MDVLKVRNKSGKHSWNFWGIHRRQIQYFIVAQVLLHVTICWLPHMLALQIPSYMQVHGVNGAPIRKGRLPQVMRKNLVIYGIFA